MMNDTEEYIIFQYMGKWYAVMVGNYFQIPVIFRYKNDREIPFVIAEELMKDFEEVWEVVMLKYEYKIDEGHYLDYHFMDEYDEMESNELVLDSEYLELVEKFRLFLMRVAPNNF